MCGAAPRECGGAGVRGGGGARLPHRDPHLAAALLRGALHTRHPPGTPPGRRYTSVTAHREPPAHLGHGAPPRRLGFCREIQSWGLWIVRQTNTSRG
eukprot:5791059-Pyramimonas_sp.AAC.1